MSHIRIGCWNRNWARVMVVIGLAWGIRASALDDSDLLFHAPFDQGTDALKSSGDPKGQVKGGAQLAAPDADGKDVGRFGKGLLIEKYGDSVVFQTQGNFPAEEGSISLWVKLLDFEKGMRKSMPVVQLYSPPTPWTPEENLSVWRQWQPHSIGLCFWQNKKLVGQAAANAEEMTKGTWYHLCVTFRKKEFTCYLNGVGGPGNAAFKFEKFPSEFIIGYPDKPTQGMDDFTTGEHMLATLKDLGKEPYGKYMIDDLAVFKRVLTEKEIKLLSQMPVAEALKSGGDVAGQPRQKLLHYPSLKQLWLTDFWPGRKLDAGSEVVLIVSKTGGVDEVFSAPVKSLEGIQKLDIAQLEKGEYDARTAIRSGGKTVAATEPKRVVVPDLNDPRWHNELGNEDVLPPPWTPLKVTGDAISASQPVAVDVWGRTIAFGNVLPTQISILGEDALAAPINFVSVAGGKDLPLTLSGSRVALKKDTRVVFESDAKLGEAEAKVRVEVEFDGMIRVDLVFPAQQRKLPSLRLDVPMKPELAELMYYSCRRSGEFPEKPWNAAFSVEATTAPYTVWFGNDLKGIQWFCESDAPFRSKERDKQIQIWKDKTAAWLRVNFADIEVDLSKGYAVTVGLHPTPTKPRPKGWRSWNAAAGAWRRAQPERFMNLGLAYSWWAKCAGSLAPKELPNPPIPAPERRPSTLQMPFCSLIFYHPYDYGAKELNEEWRIFGDEWVSGLGANNFRGENTDMGWGPQADMAQSSRTYQDWLMHQADSTLRACGTIHGYYIDGYCGGASDNLGTGAGYVDANGFIRKTVPIFAARQMNKRLYALVKKHRPNYGITWTPSYLAPIASVLSFQDAIFDGEFTQWADISPGKTQFGLISDKLPRSFFRALWAMKNFGPVQVVDSRVPSGEQPDFLCNMGRNQLMMWVSHDIMGWGGAPWYGSENLFMQQYLDYFGMEEDDVEYIGYWDKRPGALGMCENMVYSATVKQMVWPNEKPKPVAFNDGFWISCWKRPGKALIMICHPQGYGDSRASVVLDLERLGLAGRKLRAVDVETFGKLEIPIVDGNKLMDIETKDQYRLVQVEAVK